MEGIEKPLITIGTAAASSLMLPPVALLSILATVVVGALWWCAVEIARSRRAATKLTDKLAEVNVSMVALKVQVQDLPCRRGGMCRFAMMSDSVGIVP